MEEVVDMDLPDMQLVVGIDSQNNLVLDLYRLDTEWLYEFALGTRIVEFLLVLMVSRNCLMDNSDVHLHSTLHLNEDMSNHCNTRLMSIDTRFSNPFCGHLFQSQMFE